MVAEPNGLRKNGGSPHDDSTGGSEIMRVEIMRVRNNQKLACASGQTAANSLTQALNEARDRGDIELLERIPKDPQAFILKHGWGWRGLAAGRMPMDGESWMPREAGWAWLGLNCRDPLTCAPGGSAPPFEELRALYEHLQARILEMIEPSSLKLRRAKDAGRGAGNRRIAGRGRTGGRGSERTCG
jgi:hypothetical protein